MIERVNKISAAAPRHHHHWRYTDIFISIPKFLQKSLIFALIRKIFIVGIQNFYNFDVYL